MKIIMVIGGDYGSRIVNTLALTGFASNIVDIIEYSHDSGEFIDDTSSMIPSEIPNADLTLAAGLKGDLNLLAAEIAVKASSKALIIESHEPLQLPEGLKDEISDMLECVVFPAPFCSLEPVGNKYIDVIASKLGKPELEIKSNKLINSVKVKKSAPCGSTFYVAKEIQGVPVAEAEILAGEKLHNYPCLASMETDPRFGDTPLHIAGYLTREAVKRATRIVGAHASVDPDICMGSECGFICMDNCPLTRLSKTIIKDEIAKIDPISCGACGKCVSKCPYGAIKIIHKVYRKEPSI